MTKEERGLVCELLFDVVAKVPGPAGGGSQSADLRGIVTHSADMVRLAAIVRDVLGELVAPGLTYCSPREHLEEAKMWIKDRVAADWQ